MQKVYLVGYIFRDGLKVTHQVWGKKMHADAACVERKKKLGTPEFNDMGITDVVVDEMVVLDG